MKQKIGFQFGYTFQRFTVAANQTREVVVTIDSDFNFVMNAIMGRIVQINSQVDADALLQFTDSTTTETWFASPTLQQLILSTAKDINPPMNERTVRKQSNIKVNVQNLNAFEIQCDIYLRGYKLNPLLPQINANASNSSRAIPAQLAQVQIPTVIPKSHAIGESFEYEDLYDY